MSDFAVIGDTHFGIRGGDLMFLEHQLQWLEKSFKAMKAKGIKTILQAGDFMDNRKSLDVRVGWMLAKRFLALLDQYQLDFVTILGNHNLFYRESTEIHNMWFLESHPRFFVVSEPKEYADHDILLVPWICKENEDRVLKAIADSKASVCMGHFEFANFPMYNGVLAMNGRDPADFKKFKLVVSGHYHTISHVGNVHYTGSPYHLTWADFPDGENRGWFVLNTKKAEMDLQPNTPSDTLFRIHNYNPDVKYEPALLKHLEGAIVRFIVKDKGDTKRYNKFLSCIKEIKMIDYKIVDETIVQAQPQQAINVNSLVSNPMAVIVDYVGTLAETVTGANVAQTRELAKTLYERANTK